MAFRIKKQLESLGTAIRLTLATHPKNYVSEQFDRAKGCFVNPVALRKVKKKYILSALVQSLRGDGQRTPSEPLPNVRPNWSEFLSDRDTTKFIWFGHSSVLMRINGTTIAIDPVLGASVSPLSFNMRRFQPPAATLDEWPAIDWVLLSHNHYDHFETETLKQLAQQGTRFIVPLGVAHYFTLFGIDEANVVEMDWWQQRKINDLQISFVPGTHTTGRGLNDKNKSLWGGYIIQNANQTIYFSGDSCYGQHFAQIAQRFPNIDVAFIENGQYDWRWVDHHMMPEDTVQAALDISPRRIVPIHWGAYSLSLHPWYEPVRKSIPEMKRRGLSTLTPLQGQVFDIETETEEWFWQIDPSLSESDV